MSVFRFTALAVTLALLGVPSASYAVDGAIRPVSHFNYYNGGGGCASGGCASAGCATASCGDSCSAPSCGACDATCGCGDVGCGSCCPSACCGGGGGGLLGMSGFSLQDMLLGDSPITVGGWTQFGYHDDATNTLSPQTAVSFNDRPGKLNLHQQWFYVEKVADGSNGLDWGFRTDIMYGIDGTDTQAFGNPPGTWDFQNGLDHGAYSWALPQAYLELASGDWTVKAGHFYTLAGYEVVTAPDNFFYSHAFTMINSEPFTHTGAVASLAMGDMTVYGGWTLGWDTGFEQFQGGSSFLGGVSLPLMQDVMLTYIATAGDLGWRGDNGYSHSVVMDVTLTENLNYVLQSDMVDADTGGAVANDDSVGINNYLLYTVNDWLRTGSRMEWWKGDGESHYGMTSGLNVLLADNLIWRPEYRHQWSPANGTRQSIFGMDMILTY